MNHSEIMTKALLDTIESSRNVESDIKSASLEREDANIINKANSNVVNAVGTLLKVRIASPKLVAMDAKMIESGSTEQNKIAS